MVDHHFVRKNKNGDSYVLPVRSNWKFEVLILLSHHDYCALKEDLG